MLDVSMLNMTKRKIAFIGRIVNVGLKEEGRKAVYIPKQVLDSGIPRTKQVKVTMEEFEVEV